MVGSENCVDSQNVEASRDGEAFVPGRALPNLQNLVGQSGPGLRTHQIYRNLVEQPVSVTRDRLATCLLHEQGVGTLRFRDRRWCARDEDDEGNPDDAGQRLETSRRRDFLDTIPADVLPGSPLAVGETQGESADKTVPEGWLLLRRLLPHYRGCLRLAGASGLSQHLDRYRQQFELIRPRGRWWPDQAGARVMRVDRRQLAPEFIEGLYKRQTDPLLLGYPLSITLAGDGHVFIDPVATLPCAWQIDDAALTLWPTEAVPKLNPDWIKRRKERRAIRGVSLWLKGIDDDRTLSQPQGDAWADIPDFVNTLRAVSAAPTMGSLDPGQSAARLDLDADGSLQNVIGLFLVAQSPYSRGAQRDLSDLEAWTDDEYAASALTGIFSSTNVKSDVQLPVIAPLPISESQYLAVRDGLSQPLTVISGPPGTGKSQVVVAVMVSAAAAGRSVLFVSHRHQAIDAVQNRLEELAGDLPLLARAYAGGREESFSFDQAISLILGRQIGTQAVENFERKKTVSVEFGEKLDRMIERITAFEELGERLGQLNDELARRERAAAKSLVEAPSSLFARIGNWLVKLHQRLIRATMRNVGNGDQPISLITNDELRRQLRKTEAEHRQMREAVASTPENASLPALLESLSEQGQALLPALIDAKHACSDVDAAALVDLHGNLGLVQGAQGLRTLWEENARLVLKYFPLWACSTLAVSTRIPLVSGLFDYLVVDEATTSDIASALPLFARARSAIVVGDRQQTGLISDLHPVREAEMRQRAGLSHPSLGRFTFSRVSLFDLAWVSNPARRHMLRDHFRCHAEIAGYCSETFYGGRLFVRTDAAHLRVPIGQKPGLHWTDARGPVERAGNGCRSLAEATALVDHLVGLIGEGAYDGTVGVVTPFNRQSELLTHMVEQRIPRDLIDRVKLRVGTSHAFQGDDRDVVLVSLCYGRGMPRNGDWFLRNSRELMNVAISRARAVCHIFGDRDAARASDIAHISRLATYIGAEGSSPGDPRKLFESPWEERLYDAMCAAGLNPLPQYRLGGRRLDLAVIENDIRLDVEVDGDSYHRDPDGFRKVSDLWRDHVVNSLGWKVRRFWVYELKENMEACIESIRRDIDY